MTVELVNQINFGSQKEREREREREEEEEEVGEEVGGLVGWRFVPGVHGLHCIRPRSQWKIINKTQNGDHHYRVYIHIFTFSAPSLPPIPPCIS